MGRKEVLFGLVIAFFLAVAVAPFASPWPDGLEKVAENIGFIHLEKTAPIVNAPLADYAWPNIGNERMATSIAGLAGTLLVFAFVLGIGMLLKKD